MGSVDVFEHALLRGASGRKLDSFAINVRNQGMEKSRTTDREKSARWWPAVVVLALVAAALMWIWVRSERSRQDNIIATIQTLGVGLVLLLVWVGVFSRLRLRVRLVVLGGVLGVLGLTALLFEVRGVTGDLRPILEWRWKSRVLEEEARKAPSRERAVETGLTEPVRSASEAEFPEFMGPGRTGTLEGPKLDRNWTTHPPQVVWRRPVGAAWSGFAISRGRAVTQEQHGDQERVVCYDLGSGETLWTQSDSARYFTVIAGEGPRATPTISGNRVFAVGATGILHCLDFETGRRLWAKNILEEHSGAQRDWGYSGSPLVVSNLVVVNPGGRSGRSVVAYDILAGTVVWGKGTDPGSYSSPCRVRLGGIDQILMFGAHGLVSHDLSSGTVLWEYPWPGNHPNVAVPIVLPGDRVLLSSGYGRGSALIQIENNPDWSARQIWKSVRLKAKFSNLLYFQDHIYGLDDGTLVCLSAEDGSLKWKDGRYGHGQMIRVGELVLLMAESGEIVLLEPDPRERRELARLKVFSDKTWNPPALAGEYLMVRNDQEAACLRIRTVEP